LNEGIIEVTEGQSKKSLSLKIWVDANNPVVHIESKSDQPVSMKVVLQNWRANGEGDTI